MELDQLYVIGVDQTAPIEIREKVSFDKRILEVLDNIKANPGVSEAVALSTCHRSEIYTIVEDVASIDLEKLFCNFLSSEDEKLKPYIFLYQGLDAVKHI